MQWRGSRLAAVRRTICSTPTDVLLVWDEHARQDYLVWQRQDREVLNGCCLVLVPLSVLVWSVRLGAGCGETDRIDPLSPRPPSTLHSLPAVPTGEF